MTLISDDLGLHALLTGPLVYEELLLPEYPESTAFLRRTLTLTIEGPVFGSPVSAQQDDHALLSGRQQAALDKAFWLAVSIVDEGEEVPKR